VPERSWVQSLLPTTEVEPGFSTFGGMLVPVLQLISPVCKTGTAPRWYHVRTVTHRLTQLGTVVPGVPGDWRYLRPMLHTVEHASLVLMQRCDTDLFVFRGRGDTYNLL
jgi:hypothetical protein